MTDKKSMREYVEKIAEERDYYLCPDEELLEDLIEGLAKNKDSYGYPSCPCRPASGKKKYDNDIICPCDYSDADVEEYGTCYCGLFVSKEVNETPSKLEPIPERRPKEIINLATSSDSEGEKEMKSEKEKESEEVEVWRCEVCGYLCAREVPPPICPICKAKSDKFEQFDL